MLLGLAGLAGIDASVVLLRPPSGVPVFAFDVHPSVRAFGPALLAFLFGGAAIFRYGARIERAVERSMTNPLSSALYGFAAAGGLLLLTAYAYSQLARIDVGTELLATLGVVALAAVALALSGYGFAVVGAWLASALGVRDPLFGLVGVSAACGVATYVLPTLVGLLVWAVVVAVGIGGPAREWIYRDAVGAVDR